MLFSAIALVAFTATSMAGEIEETKVVSEIKIESKNIVFAQPLIVMSYCEGLFLFIRDKVAEETGMLAAAEAIAIASFQACVEHELD
jgi:hypothetical protein